MRNFMLLLSVLTAQAHGVTFQIHSGRYDAHTCKSSRQVCFSGYKVRTGSQSRNYTYAKKVLAGGSWKEVKTGTQKVWDSATCRYRTVAKYEQKWEPAYQTEHHTATKNVPVLEERAGYCTDLVETTECYSYQFQGHLVPCHSSAGYPYFMADTASWSGDTLTSHGTDTNESNAFPYGDEVTRQVGRGRRRH